MKLRQLFLANLLLILSVHIAFGQKSYGIRAGANFSTVSGGDLQDVSKITNYYVGVYKEIPLVAKILFIQPELQFSKQGFSLKTDDINLNYINVPVLAKVYVLKFLSIETGPQFGFKVGGTDSSVFNFNTVDKAWAAGLSFHLPFGLSVDGRYVGSFNEFATNTNSKNQVAQVGLGFRF